MTELMGISFQPTKDGEAPKGYFDGEYIEVRPGRNFDWTKSKPDWCLNFEYRTLATSEVNKHLLREQMAVAFPDVVLPEPEIVVTQEMREACAEFCEKVELVDIADYINKGDDDIFVSEFYKAHLTLCAKGGA